MVDVSNRVYSNVEKYVKTAYPSVHCQNSLTATPDSFPSMAVRQIDAAEVAVDMDGGDPTHDFAVNSSVEIQVYSAKSITEAKTIINQACDAMRGMAYSRRYGPSEVQDRAYPNMYRMVARFSRIISGLDEIPKFNSQ